jgi:hypothetical protein
VDIDITVCIGQFSVDIAVEGADGPYLDQAFHFLGDHIAELSSTPR